MSVRLARALELAAGIHKVGSYKTIGLNLSFTKESRADPPKGFSSITFEQNDLVILKFAICNFNNIGIGEYDQIQDSSQNLVCREV